MISWGTKYLLIMTSVCYIAALVYGIVTGGNLVGVISIGYKGGVGDHLGYGMMISFSVALLLLTFIGFVADQGPKVDEKGNSLELNPIQKTTPTYWPALLSLSLALVVIGIAFSRAFLIFGIALMLLVIVQWSIQSWADGISENKEVNRVIRDRVASPFDLPLLSLFSFAFIVLGISRIMLAVSTEMSVVVAMVAALLVFLSAIYIVYFKVSQKTITTLVAIGIFSILIGGIVAAGVGERDFSHAGSHEEAVE